MGFSLRMFVGHLNQCSNLAHFLIAGMSNFTICIVCIGASTHSTGQQTQVTCLTGSLVTMNVDETLPLLLSELYDASFQHNLARCGVMACLIQQYEFKEMGASREQNMTVV